MRVQLRNLTVSVGSPKRKLFSIKEFDVSSGQRVLIKGASGKGKTSLLHVIAGLMSPFEGLIKLGDLDITKATENERAAFRRQNVGIVFQKLNLIEYLTPKENVELGAEVELSEESALSALKVVGLSERASEKVAGLSLGEQQRVAVARILANPKPLILADEPTSSLDEVNANQVIDLLLKASEKATLLLVSHDKRIEERLVSEGRALILDFNQVATNQVVK